ncbi:unnamed protein product [Periconia digitata]|uniref:Exo-1,4-beta-D-glucosaminidase n=1 Tax=Periconia digitata TaxID=1303443 RepID=A0A9W4XIA9_9PLEO|nr:unnamed protein product [Periconia digitata]
MMMMMMMMMLAVLVLCTTPFVPTPAQAQILTIPSWHIQSTTAVGNDAVALSSPNLDVSAWYETRSSKATLMAALLDHGVYNETSLFYSDNLKDVDTAVFQVPWVYRAEFDVGSVAGSEGWGNGTRGAKFYQLRTNGISSRADVYLNGEVVVGGDDQAGAYTGVTVDVTDLLVDRSGGDAGNAATGHGGKVEKNVLLIRVYPTDYNRDFALGFVDWNPYPPDNGTGVWRDVEIVQTGAIGIESVSVNTELDGQVRFGVDVRNWGGSDGGGVEGEVECIVYDPQGQEVGRPRTALNFKGDAQPQQKTILTTKIPSPQIWWPKQWGSQPLYNTTCRAFTTGSGLSSTHPPFRFGIRKVTSSLNPQNDILFNVNNIPFQVLAAGYTSDIFLRFSPTKLQTQLQLVQAMGLNTIRLEGKQEHAPLYALADELGLMILAGWECCDKWEGWSYNDEASGLPWTPQDYSIANSSMRHEASLMQSHPSMLGFLVGSDFWPDDTATQIYVDALQAYEWDTPIISSASQRGFPALLGNSGMKMEGPYDWVPPNYWPSSTQLGGAFGFGSELGAGVGTPLLPSLSRFLSPNDLEDLWKEPNKGLYHMSTEASSFYTREIYNSALWARYGTPGSLEDYLEKAQMADFEATQAQFGMFAARWSSADRPATGLVYWMLNNAWPSLHWNLFDFYLQPGGSFYGVKAAISDLQTLVYDYETSEVYVVDRGLVVPSPDLKRTVDIEVMNLKGEVVGGITHSLTNTTSLPNSSAKLPLGDKLSTILSKIENVAFLRLRLLEDPSTTDDNPTITPTRNNSNTVVYRTTYTISAKKDILDYDESTWYHTPVSSFADYTALNDLSPATLRITAAANANAITLENTAKTPAVFVRLAVAQEEGGESDAVVVFSRNYLTLWPGETIDIEYDVLRGGGKMTVEVQGKNVESEVVSLGI